MKFLFLFSALFLLGCSTGGNETPYSYGYGAGEYFVNEWTKDPLGPYPSGDAIASYCANLAYDQGIELDWTMEEILESSDACINVIFTELIQK